jgi:hypothetical protein
VRVFCAKAGNGRKSSKKSSRQLDNQALKFDNGLVLNKSRFRLANRCLSELGGGFFI